MRIDSSGNVGIGTSSPSDKLTVISAGTQVGSTNFRNIARIGLATNDASVLLGYDVSAGSAILASTNNYPIAFWTSIAGTYAEKMRIDSSGLVGIGTNAPSSYGGALVVRKANTGQGVTNATAQFSDAVNSALWVGHTSGATNLVADAALTFGYTNGTTTTERMRIDSSGNVGIGTSSLNQTGFTAPVLSITNGTSGIIELIGTQTADGTVGAIAFYNTSSSIRIAQILGWRSGANNSGALIFQTNNAGTLGEAGRFDSSGNLGIGTTSPASVTGYKLIEVQGSTGGIFQTSASGNSVKARFYSTNLQGYTGTTSNHPFAFLTNDIERVTIDTSGNLLVGTTSAIQAGKYSSSFNGLISNGIVLQTTYASTGTDFVRCVNSAGTAIGNITQNGATTVAYNTSSDYRLKNTITAMTGALAKVALLKPVTYKWNADGSNGEGFIAHELAEVVPDCVSGEKDGLDKDGNPKYQGIDTSFLVATLTAAIQELKALVDTQSSTITALTARITALESI
jgi:hypothetical protein